MLLPIEECLTDLRCPVSKSKLVIKGDRIHVSEGPSQSSKYYDLINGKPVLIDFEKSVVKREQFSSTNRPPHVKRQSYSGLGRIIKRILSPELSATKQNVKKMKEDLLSKRDPARLLIVGGGTIGNSMESLYNEDNIRVYSFDIYESPMVQFIADAHSLPLPSDFFDAVVVQAVLEHVLRPDAVVAEIWRVLKPDGVVYAETPFLQHVHEGALDFHRFTDSGHRYLFRNFELIDSGVCGGPGIQLMWSVDYFVRGLFRSRLAGKVAKAAFSWAQYFDAIIPASYSIDAASGVYFLGKKAGHEISASEVVKYYQGAN